MTTLEWARSVKPDLVRLQIDRGIPALFAATQMCHESASGGGLSDLAREAHNYAGLKWSQWQEQYGCTPVVYGTWEVIEGQRVDLDDAFCKSPSWEVWLKVYADLLTGKWYGGALKYKYDPFLYGYHVWSRGWATNPAYLQGIASWMNQLWEDYKDTIPLAPYPAVPILSGSGRRLATGVLAVNTTLAPVRRLSESLGQKVEWVDGKAILEPPGEGA